MRAGDGSADELSTSRQSGARTSPCHGTSVVESVFWQLDVAASHASNSMYMLPVVALLDSFCAGLGGTWRCDGLGVGEGHCYVC